MSPYPLGRPLAWGSVLFLVGLLHLPPSALCAEPPPSLSPEVEAMVERHVQVASEHFTGGRYAEAVSALRQAHELDPQPIFLFNIAQSLRRGQRLREALQMYGRFLRVDPKTSLRAETQGYMNELSVLLEKQEQLERERRRPAWKKGWFWAVLGAGTVVLASGLGLGLGLGLRDDRAVIELR